MIRWNRESTIFYVILAIVVAALIWPEKTFEILVSIRDSIKSLISSSEGEPDVQPEPDTGRDG